MNRDDLRDLPLSPRKINLQLRVGHGRTIQTRGRCCASSESRAHIK
jgi:hypothetical protein